MEYRQGICSSCQNTFRVPATFQLPKAKCPKCGGVVEIGPVQTAASPAAKARPAEGTKTPEGTKPPEGAKPPEPVRVLELKERPAAQQMTTRPIRESAGEREPAPAAVEPGGEGARVQKRKVGQKTRKARRRALVGKKKKSSLPILAGLLLVVAGGAFAVKKLGGQSGPEAPAQAPAPVAKPDLSHIPDASKHPETTDTEWAEMNELMAGYIKPPFDRNAERSGDLLARKGLRAVPAILNGWKRVAPAALRMRSR